MKIKKLILNFIEFFITACILFTPPFFIWPYLQQQIFYASNTQTITITLILLAIFLKINFSFQWSLCTLLIVILFNLRFLSIKTFIILIATWLYFNFIVNMAVEINTIIRKIRYVKKLKNKNKEKKDE